MDGFTFFCVVMLLLLVHTIHNSHTIKQKNAFRLKCESIEYEKFTNLIVDCVRYNSILWTYTYLPYGYSITNNNVVINCSNLITTKRDIGFKSITVGWLEVGLSKMYLMCWKCGPFLWFLLVIRSQWRKLSDVDFCRVINYYPWT